MAKAIDSHGILTRYLFDDQTNSCERMHFILFARIDECVSIYCIGDLRRQGKRKQLGQNCQFINRCVPCRQHYPSNIQTKTKTHMRHITQISMELRRDGEYTLQK